MTSSAHRSSKSPTIRRILREAAEMTSSPSPDYSAEPLESDLFEWHFTLRGPPNSVFSEGIYHGRITLPNTYPLRPPNFRFATPNGRFEVNREICLSISGHHEETWQPAWGIRTAIVALRSFMETDAKGQLGGLDTPEVMRLQLATKSGVFKCPLCAKSNSEIIQESADRAAKLESSKQETELPAELSFRWKDELETQDRLYTKAGDGGQEDNRETGQLAEEFDKPLSAQATALELEVARPRAPMGAASAPSPARPTQHALRPQINQVPRWIDRLIVALSVVLLCILCKVLFAS